MAARGRGFPRQARRPDRHRLDRHPGGPGDRRDRRPPDGIPEDGPIQRARAQRAARGRVRAIRARAPRGNPGGGALDAERPSVPHRPPQGVRGERCRAAGDLRGGVGERRAAIPRELPRHAARQGGERYRGRIRKAQDPRDRQGSENRASASGYRSPLCREAPADRHELFRDLQPRERHAGGPARRADRAHHARRHQDARRANTRWTSSSSPPASTR